MKILTFIQQTDGKINNNSLEALKGSQEIAQENGGTVTAITFNNKPSIEELSDYDVSEIILVNNAELDSYSPLHFISAMKQIIEDVSPQLIIFGHTYQARDWVPRLAIRINASFISDCIGFKSNNGEISFVRPMYQGKINADIVAEKMPCIISFQSGAFRSDNIKPGSASINNITLDLGDVNNSIRPAEKFQEAETTVDLTQAEVIVSIGRGISKEENLPIVHALAKALGGSVASSRPIVDSGWLEPYHQIGSSGQTVAPKLYLALGISGAIQHVVGMKSSQNVVVINKDANAPFFELADYGIIGDILEIIPKLTAELESR